MSNTNFVRYDAYKDSGVEWLGEVPAHWDICRLKELSNIQNSNVDKKSHEGETHVQLCNYVDVYKNEFINVLLNFMWATADESEIKRFRIKKNDVLITKDSETCDDIAIPALATESLDGVLCGYHLAQFRTKDKTLLGSYLFRLFQSKSYGFRFVISAKGITRVGLGQSAIINSLTPVPPLLEQTTIAAYLDTKTAHIDRKIDLLRQKAAQYGMLKQSLINEAVTRGLDKTVAMKDSGIEWIGEVPAHWWVKRVKELFNISRGRVIAQTELVDEGKFPVYSSQTKRDGCLGYINTFDHDGTYITWTTDGVNAGTVFLRRGKFNCTNICGTLKLKRKNSDIAYLFYSLQVSTKHNKRIDTNGAKIMSNEMMFIKISVPPIVEQKSISNYLNEKTAQIDRIVETINSQIEKLKELRKTLINDVVTGKIKVMK